MYLRFPAATGPSTTYQNIEQKDKVENKRLVDNWCMLCESALWIVLHHILLNVDAVMCTHSYAMNLYTTSQKKDLQDAPFARLMFDVILSHL